MQHITDLSFILHVGTACCWVLLSKKSSLSPNDSPGKDLALLQPILCDFLFSSALQHLYSSCIRMPAATAI